MTDHIGDRRYQNKRNLGISKTRRDNSEYNTQDDRRGADFEKFAAEYFGVSFDENLYEGGDHGIDLVVNGVVLGCYCAGIRYRKDGSSARLIKNYYDKVPQIHVVGVPLIEGSFEFIGWIPHWELEARGREVILNNGVPDLKLTWPLDELWSMEQLSEILNELSDLKSI